MHCEQVQMGFMRQRPGVALACSQPDLPCTMHRDDHLLVGTKCVPIGTDPFAVHAASAN